ncbi:hypothetical protein GE09DRAFT_466993 [Coniochaeta sp. 2T2.1]|nr:hypothetical protein GE09DRAFT_466993 [Coniochaeta sp. 2T2.1]
MMGDRLAVSRAEVIRHASCRWLLGLGSFSCCNGLHFQTSRHSLHASTCRSWRISRVLPLDTCICSSYLITLHLHSTSLSNRNHVCVQSQPQAQQPPSTASEATLGSSSCVRSGQRRGGSLRRGSAEGRWLLRTQRMLRWVMDGDDMGLVGTRLCVRCCSCRHR